jgi:hypothetical protein
MAIFLLHEQHRLACCSKCSGTSISAARVDCHFEGAQSSATHALSVERVCWNGLGHIQSDDDTADVIGPSQDTACVLRSFEDAHLELVLG